MARKFNPEAQAETVSGTTNRGFSWTQFKDLYGAQCSLQESSIATEEAIWLGCDDATHYDMGAMPITLPADGVKSCAARMHLNRKQAKWLVKQLKHFIKTGSVELV